ncbi:hypothetical protein [Epilithonimonas xixisoli]|uniref:Uncharacterized protein n=1 Tax=Epilithonimonas xixisoli TaxID=1476462 RepID=A0A4R8I4T7_9FLAO|nr:hypothetical protein [Epilithonimonas xixisoli]TDX83293.1 hypothetical protein B0I22_3373 [Epilithonimonas xixisoli]
MKLNPKNKKPLKKNKSNVYKRILVLLIILFLFKEIIIYKPILNFIRTEKIVGEIINNKNSLRRGQFTGAFVYSYQFVYKNKIYTNKSDNEKFKVGEKLIVECNETFPFINRIYKSRFTD